MTDTAIRFAKRLDGPLGATRVVGAMVQERRAAGITVIDAGQGSPSFTPERNVVIKRIETAADSMVNTKYAPTLGFEEERKKVAPYISDLLGGGEETLDPKLTHANMGFVVGGSDGVFLANMLVGGEDSSILIPRPGYSNYPSSIAASSAALGYYETGADYIPSFQQLVDAVERGGGQRVKAMIFNFPGNPTSATLDRAKAEKLGHDISELVKRYPHLLIVNDLAYIETARQGEQYTFYPFLSEQAKANVVNIFSASKGASLANDRTGLVATTPEILNKINLLSSGVTMGINTVGVAGFAEAAALYYEHPNLKAEARDHYQSRLKILTEGLNDIAARATGGTHRVAEKVPGGGIFLYGDLSYLIGHPVPEKLRAVVGSDTVRTDADIVTMLLNLHEYGYAPAAAIPGGGFSNSSGFGDDPKKGKLRIAAIESPQILRELVTSFAGLTQLVMGVDLGAKPNIDAVAKIQQRENDPDRASAMREEVLREALARELGRREVRRKEQGRA